MLSSKIRIMPLGKSKTFSPRPTGPRIRPSAGLRSSDALNLPAGAPEPSLPQSRQRVWDAVASHVCDSTWSSHQHLRRTLWFFLVRLRRFPRLPNLGAESVLFELGVVPCEGTRFQCCVTLPGDDRGGEPGLGSPPSLALGHPDCWGLSDSTTSDTLIVTGMWTGSLARS